jgi:hypothetical protein
MPGILSSVTIQIFHKLLLQIIIIKRNDNNAELEEIHKASQYLTLFYLA